jgi:hypothetical protein
MPGLFSSTRAVSAFVVLVLAAGGVALLLASSSSTAHAASMPLSGRSSAELEITAGMPVLDVTTARLGGTLLRVSTPSHSAVRPILSGTAPVTLALAGVSGQGPVDVVLNSAVTWSLDFAGGTQRTNADLRGGKVSRIDVSAGSDVLDVSLPRPAGTLPFLLAGGVTQFTLSLPGGVPAQVRVGGGAAEVSMGGQDLTGVAGGTVLTPPGWSAATSRFDIDATAGFSRLTVSRW